MQMLHSNCSTIITIVNNGHSIGIADFADIEPHSGQIAITVFYVENIADCQFSRVCSGYGYRSSSGSTG